MSSISAYGAGGSYASPLQRLQQELANEVSAGTVSSSDAGALSTALTDINSALTGGQSSSQSSNGQPPSPDGIKNKINDLIANEVSNGTLTTDQATELKNVFANAFAGGPGGQGGAQGAGGASSSSGASSSDGSFTLEVLFSSGGGASSAGSSSFGSAVVSLQAFLASEVNQAAASASSGSTPSSSASSSTSSSNTSSDISNLVQDFLKLVQDSQQSNASTYGANGSSSTSANSFSALLINYQA
jgi:hypothetical protein